MTELEHIEIEGFKGLEHVEFEPTDINLITGRNNTGKTSFLEAVELFHAPEIIQQFRGNAGAIVNHSSSEVVVESRTGSGFDRMTIRPASIEESKRYLREAVTEYLQSSLISRVSTTIDPNSDANPDLSASSVADFENLDKPFRDAISKIINRTLSEIPESTGGIQLIITLNGGEYPYLFFDKENTFLSQDDGDIVKEVLLEEFGEETVHERPGGESVYQQYDSYTVENPTDNSSTVTFRGGFPRIPTGGLFLKQPPKSENITSIVSGELTETVKDADDEDDAVRVDDIGDFIKEKGFVDQLKTFSLDTLIFEAEDGEKQPVPYDFMGDGFKSMVGLLWKLMDDDIEDQIVLIEEPETHMHPGYVAELVHFLIDLARDEDIQFFVTTHDHDFIKDFFMDMPEEKREYLEDEFSLVKMDDFGADVMEYEEAEHHLKDLHLDLRGI